MEIPGSHLPVQGNTVVGSDTPKSGVVGPLVFLSRLSVLQKILIFGGLFLIIAGIVIGVIIFNTMNTQQPAPAVEQNSPATSEQTSPETPAQSETPAATEPAAQPSQPAAQSSGGQQTTGQGGGSSGGGGGGGSSGGSSGGDTTSCALPKYPTPSCTGVPAGWSATTTINGDLNVTTAGAVIENYLVNGDINVRASNVTIRKTMVREGGINNEYNNVCYNGMLLEDVSITPAAGQTTSYAGANGVVGPGGYTARRVEIDSRVEGFRAGGDSIGCGAVVIEDSFIKLRVPPGSCGTHDWHTDGIQGYDADLATIRHNTIDYDVPCGTGPLYNASTDADGGLMEDNLIVGSGGYALELHEGTWSKVTGFRIAGNWSYGALDVGACADIAIWRDNRSATVDSNYNVTSVGGLLANGCTESP